MTTQTRFSVQQLFNANNVNLDHFTENYNISYYMRYLCQWGDCCHATTAPSGRMTGYIIGKVEGEQRNWHGHVTALTVDADYRRLGMAKLLMQTLEVVTDQKHAGYFVDLFVRKSNDVAVSMYKTLGYVVYREIIGYYSGEENAFDMRKALSRDPEKRSMIPLKYPVPADSVD